MPRPPVLPQPLLQFDDQVALLEGAADEAISAMPKIEAQASTERGFTDALASGDDLSAQRWGLIVPLGPLGDRLLDCVSPLIEQRARQQDIPKEQIIVLRVPSGSDLSSEAARAWRDECYETIADWDRPTYLLILGDLHEVPESIHRIFIDRLVGRLAFSLPGGEPDFAAYRKYAEKVLRWESTPSPHKKARARLLVVNDGTAATNTAMDVLVNPLFALAARAGQRFPLSDINPTDAAWLTERQQLLAQATTGVPTVLFSVSHGYGGPRRGWPRENSDQQRAEQGALCFAASKDRLYGRDLSAMPSFLPGGIWVLLACHGAGTPRVSHYRHWLERLAACGEFAGSAESVLRALPTDRERPFIAALPQAALAHPEGPLACIGHLDLAWTYSFQDLDTGQERSRPDAFFGVLRTLARRGRVGLAYAQLLQALQQTHVHLTDLYDTAEASQRPIHPAQLGHLWMLRQDLAGFVLLGDPAARLPLGPPDA
jgi:hypothetical protein